MKVFAYPPGENWIIDRITNEFCQNTTHQLAETPTEADTIMLFAPWCWDQYKSEWLSSKKFIMMLHHIVPDKVDLDEFAERDKYVDHYIVPNKHTLAFVKEHSNKPVTQICYWLNPELWQKTDKAMVRNMLESKINTNNVIYNKQIKNLQDKFIIFSAQRDTEGAGIPQGIFKPKLEKGPDLLTSAIENITCDKENILVLLAGWRRQYIIKELESRNINYLYIERPVQAIINNLYDASDLYIVSSRFEGGCQAILECAYKKVPIISRNVGVASDILHKDCILPVEDRYILPTKEHIQYAHKKIMNLTLPNQILKFDKIIRNI